METQGWSIYKMRQARLKSNVRNTYRNTDEENPGVNNNVVETPEEETGNQPGIISRWFQKFRDLLEEEEEYGSVY